MPSTALGSDHPLPPVLRRCAVYILILSALLWLVPGDAIALYLFRHQDVTTLGLVAAMLLVIAARWNCPSLLRPVGPGRFVPLLIVVAVFVLCALGTEMVFGNYAFSGDEIMANFDADTLRTGHLMARAVPGWIDYSDALIPLFRHPVPGNVAWVANYLPGNALLRALADLTIGRAYASPILATVAAIALFRIARRLWPLVPAAPILALTLLATSPQFLVTAMTPFAMTGHLALNLLWLWCYLRDDRPGVAAALLVGFLATGLHQFVFHPLFVLPFILELMIARRWRRAAAYCAGYAAILTFWVSYWPIALALSGVAGAAANPAGGLAQVAGVAAMLVGQFNQANIVLVLLNLLRLIAWQHILIVPLAVLAWPVIRRGGGIARPLTIGILLVLIAVFVLMPNQGNGWGYRYLHGFLGSLCLLAVYGWQEVTKTGAHRPGGVMLMATLFTVLVMLPLDMVFAYRQVRPYRTAYAMIQRSGTPIVLIDARGSMTGQDLVRNAPDLHNRPLIMDLGNLDARRLRALCGRYTIAVFGRREAVLAGIPRWSDALPRDRVTPEALGCRIVRPAAWMASAVP